MGKEEIKKAMPLVLCAERLVLFHLCQALLKCVCAGRAAVVGACAFVCACALCNGRWELLEKFITRSHSEPDELESLVVKTRNLYF